ncbi:unnamed protein product [Rhodiola kirilowii]
MDKSDSISSPGCASKEDDSNKVLIFSFEDEILQGCEKAQSTRKGKAAAMTT